MKMKPKTLLLSLMLTLAVLVTGCTQLKSVVRSADDVARQACAMYFGERMGLSFEDAARSYCQTREAIEPFLDHFRMAGDESFDSLGLGGAPAGE